LESEVGWGSSNSLAQVASRRCPDRTAGVPGARDSIHPVPHPQCVRDVWPLDCGGVPEECQFPQGAPRGAPVHVCGEGPCVLVVRDSVR